MSTLGVVGTIGIVEERSAVRPISPKREVLSLPVDRIPNAGQSSAMKMIILFVLIPAAFAAGCKRNNPPKVAANPYAATKSAEQEAAKERVEARGRYDVMHDPNDTFSINSMGSD